MARYLILDHDSAALSAWDALLRMDGHDVATCADRPAAVSALLENAFDVVMTDSRVPRSRVDELVRLMRRHQPEACIFVTSARRLGHGVEGACHVFEKPVSYGGVTATVAECPARRGVAASADCHLKRRRKLDNP